MVRCKDHFTIPTDSKLGETLYIHGQIFNDTIAVHLLKHFAEDAGESKSTIDSIVDPEVNVSFIADGILLN